MGPKMDNEWLTGEWTSVRLGECGISQRGSYFSRILNSK